MRLSVLIPVYNWVIARLLDALVEEIKANNLDRNVQIVVIDDASKNGCNSDNRRHVSNNQLVKYLELDTNAGRAKIRNLLAKESEGDYLLFLDCDVVPDRNNFLSIYLNNIDDDTDVICGGVTYYQRILTDPIYDFYAFLNSQTQQIAPEVRNKMPWKFILTSNVLIKRNVFEQVEFDSGFIGYGYEDLEWGIRLSRNFNVKHIENSCSHLGLVDKENTFKRMRDATKNYALLRELHKEYFIQAPISKYVLIMEKLPVSFLRVFDKILKRWFFSTENLPLSYGVFQLDKAICLAIYGKNRKIT